MENTSTPHTGCVSRLARAGHVDPDTRGAGMGLARLSMETVEISKLERSESQPETSRSGVDSLPVSMPALKHVTRRPCSQVATSCQETQHPEHHSMPKGHLSSLAFSRRPQIKYESSSHSPPIKKLPQAKMVSGSQVHLDPVCPRRRFTFLGLAYIIT